MKWLVAEVPEALMTGRFFSTFAVFYMLIGRPKDIGKRFIYTPHMTGTTGYIVVQNQGRRQAGRIVVVVDRPVYVIAANA